MKTKLQNCAPPARLGAAAGLAAGLLLAVLPVSAQFALSAVLITAGGRLSTGGTFELNSSFGLTAAGPKLTMTVPNKGMRCFRLVR